MKHLLIILLFFVYLSAQAQKHEAWKTIGIYSGSILLNAVGDGLNDSGHKGWGHTCNAVSVGALLTSPFLINYQKRKWGWYFASYIGLRVGLFDYTYNAIRNQPLNQIGTTSGWDKALHTLNPPNTIMGRVVFLTIGISIPINELK